MATLTRESARQLTARIRDALALADDLLVRAYEGRAWEALGHTSWEAYCTAELPQLRMLRLSKVAQTEHFTALARQGLSTHATAAAYGVSQGTVRNRLKGVEGLPDTVMSRDGRVRPSKVERAPVPLVPVERLAKWQTVVRHVAAAGAAGLTCLEFERQTGWRHGASSAAFHSAQRKGYVRRGGTFRAGYGTYVSSLRP